MIVPYNLITDIYVLRIMIRYSEISAVLFGLLVCGVLIGSSVTAEEGQKDGKTPADHHETLLEKSYRKGQQFLINQYKEEAGAWPGPRGEADVAYTAMAVKVLAEGPPKHLKKHLEPFRNGVSYLLEAQQENGAILDQGKVPQFTTYKTSLATMALEEARKAYPKWKREKFRKVLEKAKGFLVNTQFSSSYHNVGKDHWAHGGYDYDYQAEKPDADLSNTQFALEALHAVDLPKDHPVWKRAVVFLQRSQNRTESNDLKEFFREKGMEVGDDGGFMYYPAKSYAANQKQPDGTKLPRSYGSMTYAGLKSYIYANLDKEDPRVKAAYRWIQQRYTLSKNPGMASKDDPGRGNQGLYYYYHTLSKALDTWGKKYLQERASDGRKLEKHHWARELVAKLHELQHEEGYWKNPEGRWMEDNPLLVTSYSLLALNRCRDWIRKE